MDFSTDWLSLGPALCVLVILLAMDVIWGFVLAGFNRQLSSSRSLVGMLKKVGVLGCVGVGMCFDLLMVNYQDLIGMGSFKPPVSIATLIALFYCAHEGVSVLEKLKLSGVPMPAFMIVLLTRLKVQAGETPAGVRFGPISVENVEAHNVKIESDVEKTDTPFNRAVERRAERRTEAVIKEVKEVGEKVDKLSDSQIQKGVGDNVHE